MEWNGLEWNGMDWNGMDWNGILLILSKYLKPNWWPKSGLLALNRVLLVAQKWPVGKQKVKVVEFGSPVQVRNKSTLHISGHPLFVPTTLQLDLMFMKHYAPNRCLYIKVAKLYWSGECRDVIPTKLQCQTIQRALESPILQREIIRKNKITFF